MSTENIINKKRRSQKIAFGIFTATSYAIVGICILAFIVTSIGVISWEFISYAKNGMTEGEFLLLLEHSVWFGEYDICFPCWCISRIYMSEYVKMAGQKNY
jgi:phosphate transport system permease protein